MTDDTEKMMKGMSVLGQLFPNATSDASNLPADFTAYTVGHLFGDVWQNDAIDLETRSLLTCSVLVALGRESEQRLHFVGAKNLGIPRERIEAAITHVAHYAGWPVAVSAFNVLADVWPKSDS